MRFSNDKRIHAGWIVLAFLIPLLSGCVAGARIQPESTQPPADGPMVARLEEGREGFIITEASVADEQTLKHFDRAIVLMIDREHAQAAELLEKVIQRSPGVTAPHINLAIAYMHMDRPEAAEDHLKTALRLVPEHPVASNEYGLLCRKAGRFEEAREIYEKALERFPDYYPLRRNLGILCDLYLNDLACALEQYEIYSAAMPEERQVKMWIADLRIRLGK
jgi:Tfp pilus assembly protein PilF